MDAREVSRSELLSRVDELLELSYGSADLGNLEDPLSETVYILLSKQTRETVYRRVFANLRRRYPRWLDVLAAGDAELEDLLRPAGFQRQRSAQLKRLLIAVESANRDQGVGPAADAVEDLTLEFLRELNDRDAERFLLSLPGIGPKSARCIMAYSLERPAFAVDTHVHRIFVRLGLVSSNGRKGDHDPFQEAVPSSIRRRLHVNLIHHGRAVCRTSKPRCGDCVLISFCPGGRQTVIQESAGAPVAVDLFAGAGGLGYGFRQAGFRVGLAVEADRHAAQTYRLNNPGTPVIEAEVGATTTATALRRYMPGVGKIAALLAGPPCQGFSAAGVRDPQNPSNLLYRHVARLAKDFKAEMVCLENVPGVRRVNGHGFLNSIRDALTGAGYATEAYLLHACEFGVPQHRARYFFLGRRGRRETAPQAPAPTHIPQHDHRSSDNLPQTPRLIDLLKVLPQIDADSFAERFVDPSGTLYWNLSTMAHSEKVIRKIRAIGAGGGPISYRRLERDEARTLIAGHRAFPVHPILDRTISVREAAIAQGFPLDYIFCGPRAWQPLQVANAVPPPLAEAVAQAVRIDMLDSIRRTEISVPGRTEIHLVDPRGHP